MGPELFILFSIELIYNYVVKTPPRLHPADLITFKTPDLTAQCIKFHRSLFSMGYRPESISLASAPTGPSTIAISGLVVSICAAVVAVAGEMIND